MSCDRGEGRNVTTARNVLAKDRSASVHGLAAVALGAAMDPDGGHTKWRCSALARRKMVGEGAAEWAGTESTKKLTAAAGG